MDWKSKPVDTSIPPRMTKAPFAGKLKEPTASVSALASPEFNTRSLFLSAKITAPVM